MRRTFYLVSLFLLVLIWMMGRQWAFAYWAYLVIVPLVLLGVVDCLQRRHTILRNFPVVGHFRYLLEMVRPEINQYFVESNKDGVPLSREQRSMVYQRAKQVRDTLPFGTQEKVYQVGYEWINHSLQPQPIDPGKLRTVIGAENCDQPYDISLLNISAMSFGSLSGRAVEALNRGAKEGCFAHNTGEGGLSPYHLRGGGDLIWQIGTGYFGCRTPEGLFNEREFEHRAVLPQVKMIEVKLSQGAKPGHGGILPRVKITKEIAKIRGVARDHDVVSPPAHTAFDSPIGLIEFIGKLRKLSGGKPVGIKLCVGKRREFLAICKAMRAMNQVVDFVAVDGSEGGTGAAPVEFSNSVGTPLVDGLIFVHNALVGFDLRSKVSVIAAGKVISGFDMIKRIALGADVCYSARGMMLALGCIQALRCNSNHCPTGITTQDPRLERGLDVRSKANRVAAFHCETMESFAHLLGATGKQRPSELHPWNILRRTSVNEVQNYSQLYDFVGPGDFLNEKIPTHLQRSFEASEPDSFAGRF